MVAKSVTKTLSKLPVREAYSASDKKIIDDTLEWMYEQKRAGIPVPKWKDVAQALAREHGVSISSCNLTKKYERSFT